MPDEAKKPKQDRYAGRVNKLRTVGLSDAHLGMLKAIEAARPGLSGVSATVRALIEEEHARLMAAAPPKVHVVKSPGGWTVARYSPAGGLELLSEHKTRKVAEAAAKGADHDA